MINITIDKKNYIYSKTALSYPKQYSLGSNVSESYNKFNAYYKQQTKDILQKMNVNSLTVTDLGSIEFPSEKVSVNDLIFQIVLVAGEVWMQGKTASKFPSYALYRLVIKNPEGKELGSYGQAIFFEGSNSKFSRPWETRYFIIQKTYPVALQNLLNRFLNDKDIYIKYKIETMAGNNKFNSNIQEIKTVFNELNARKQQIAYDMEALGIKIDDLAASNQGTAEAFKENSELYNSGSADLSNLITSAIMKHAANKEQVKNDFLIATFKQKIDEINSIEQTYNHKISTLKSSQIAFIKGTENDNNLIELYNQLANKNNTVKNEATNIYSNINKSSLNSLNQRINNAIGGSSKAETSAVRAGSAQLMPHLESIQLSSSDPCQDEANKAWRNSAEYKTYNQDPTNANASDCKAKLIELTVQYCGSKLPPNEVSGLKQVAANERNTARNLRAGMLDIDLSH